MHSNHRRSKIVLFSRVSCNTRAMPIYQLICPDCGHSFSGMVFAGTQEPEKWVCSQCGSDRAKPRADCPSAPTLWKQPMERAALVAEGALNRVEPDQGQDVSAPPWAMLGQTIR
ncbi:FmdB family zinc ribbon protein [Methyloglobulus sp.]|uniref:FmdB family zinc ribbon protein n=1 Tax=Methyloglobulus sp. TaxID=2518622 RepID=UPI003988E533